MYYLHLNDEWLKDLNSHLVSSSTVLQPFDFEYGFTVQKSSEWSHIISLYSVVRLKMFRGIFVFSALYMFISVEPSYSILLSVHKSDKKALTCKVDFLLL